jgi:type II secretory pathway pseudopilin PulG
MVPMKILNETSGQEAFSLPEVLIIVAILGILSTVSISFSNLELQRARINSIQLALAGWLQVVQRSALLNQSSSPNEGGCSVAFDPGSGKTNGSRVATATPLGDCGPNSTLFVDINNLGASEISLTSVPTIIFTPRGTTIYPDDSNSAEILFQLSNSSLVRCVRLSGIAGVIEVGSGTKNTCTDYKRL